MEVVVRLKCVAGYAGWTGEKVRGVILGHKVKVEEEVNEDDSVLVWRLSGPARLFLGRAGILARISLASVMFSSVLNSWAIKKVASKEQMELLRDMLENHTSVEWVKGPSVKEWKDSSTPFYKKLWEKWFK